MTETNEPKYAETLIRGVGAITVAMLKDEVDIEDTDIMPATVLVADLDAQGVYWGKVEKHVEDLVDDDVLVDARIDITPGKYQWQDGSFVPLKKHAIKHDKSAPSHDQAFAALLTCLAASNIKLPTECRKWQEWYATTIDAQS